MNAWKRIGVWLTIIGLLLVVRALWNIPLNHEEIAAFIASEGLNGTDLLLGLATIVLGAILVFQKPRKHIV